MRRREGEKEKENDGENTRKIEKVKSENGTLEVGEYINRCMEDAGYEMKLRQFFHKHQKKKR